MRKLIPGERHHWFPKVMAKAWAGADGLVARTNSRGDTKRRPPGAFGYQSDNHNILSHRGSPWDSSFERDFDAADRAFPRVIDWLEAVRVSHSPDLRTQGVAVDDDMRGHLAECVASLIVRSPRLRHLSEKWSAEFQVRELGFEEPQNLHQTAGSNLRRCQEPFARTIRTGGKFGILHAEQSGFLFGDGFMTNFEPSPDRKMNAMVLVAVTPRVAVLWFSPMSYPSFPVAVSMALSGAEVGRFNEIVQIYAKENLFHLGGAPSLHEAFLDGQHYIVADGERNHCAPVVDGWMTEILEVWEEG